MCEKAPAASGPQMSSTVTTRAAMSSPRVSRPGPPSLNIDLSRYVAGLVSSCLSMTVLLVELAQKLSAAPVVPQGERARRAIME
jgi:hypothetical protein